MEGTLSVADCAEEMIYLADSASLAQPLTTREPTFDIDEAYAVAREVLARREQAGWRRIGRKIGFTNRTIWDQYGVYQPIFGYMYEHTVSFANAGPGGLGATLSLDRLVQPLIEPEIVFRLSAPPPRTTDPVALLRAIEWVGHGFEVVHCHFPNWKFRPADTIADGGLHGRYVIGSRLAVSVGGEEELAEQLASFRLELSRNGALVAEGGGNLVLDSPLNALTNLIEVLDSLPDHPPLERGELITTGTLTAALPIAPGETWSTMVHGLPLQGLTVRTE